MTCQQEAGPVVVVPLAGEIDMVNCEQVYDRLYAAFVSGATVVIADFTSTSFCDCASLRRLLAVQRRAAAQGAQLRLVIPPGNPVQRLAELLGVNGRLHVYPGMHEASLLPAGGQPDFRLVASQTPRSMGPPGPDPAPAESSRTGPGGAWKLRTPICHRPS
jgi:anti-anti-sigma factor